LHSWEDLKERKPKHMQYKLPKEVVQLTVFIQQVQGAIRELLNHLFVVEESELPSYQQVHEGADQHLRLILSCLYIQDRAVYHLHHLSKHPVRVLI